MRRPETGTPAERLTAEEERALILCAQQGDREAVGRLVEAHMGFVVRVATNLRGAESSLEDLVQEGVIGLLAALRGFDLAREPRVRFLSFAKSWIERDVRRARLRDDHRFGGIRIPEERYLAAGRLTRTERALQQELGRRPTARDLSRATGLQEKAVRALLEIRARSLVLLDAESGSPDAMRPPASAQASTAGANPSAPTLLEAMLREEERIRVRLALAKLGPAEAGCLRARYGIPENDTDRGQRAARRADTSRVSEVSGTRRPAVADRVLLTRALASLRRLLTEPDPRPRGQRLHTGGRVSREGVGARSAGDRGRNRRSPR